MDWVRLFAGSDAANAGGLRFAFDFGMPFWICLLVIAAAAIAAFLYSQAKLVNIKGGLAKVLPLLRAGVIAMAVFLLLRPVLIGNKFDPARSYLLMLFDNSASMGLAKEDGLTRGATVQKALEENQALFESKLAQRFRIARYAYGEGLNRIRLADELDFDDVETNHVTAIQNATRDFQGIDVGAVVLFSDGIDQPGTPLPGEFPVPVMTVGVGDGEAWKDLALGQVSFSRSHGDRRPVNVKTSFSASGLAGRRATVSILENERVIESKTLEIATDEETHDVRLDFTPEREGWLEYNAEVKLEPLVALGDNSPATSGDKIKENNSRQFLVDNRKKQAKVLYFSGRPNWENKFIQRALKEDEEIELTTVIRISKAETKFVYRGKKSSLVNPLFEGFYEDPEDQPRYDEAVFLRIGGKASDAGKGFPEEIAELFQYDLLIMGDIEANFFSQDQLEMVRDFVRKRGGALLMLGGPNSFSEGGYEGTVVEGLLPVLLQKKRDEELEDHMHQSFRASPTMEGLLDGSWALDANPTRNQELWRQLPELAGVNLFPVTRPGASIFARVDTDPGDLKDAPLYVVQRYGEGQVAVLATGATWFWHMHTKSSDGRHARFWRQLVRGLSDDAAQQIFLRNKSETYVSARDFNIDLKVRDQLFEEKAGLITRWTSGEGSTAKMLPVDESIRETGIYSAAIPAGEPGVRRMNISVLTPEGAEIGSLEEAVLVQADSRELENPRYDPSFLKKISEASKGRFFTLDQLAEIPDQIPRINRDRSDEVRFPIWHWPGFFVLLVLLLIPEWYWRRTRGQA